MAIPDHLLGARDAAKHRVVCELRPFLAVPVDVREPDDVGRDLRFGVVAPELAIGVHAGKSEGADPVRLSRISN